MFEKRRASNTMEEIRSIWAVADDLLVLLLDLFISVQYFSKAMWFSRGDLALFRGLYIGALLIAVGFGLRVGVDMLFMWDFSTMLAMNRMVRVLPPLIFIALGAWIQNRAFKSDINEQR